MTDVVCLISAKKEVFRNESKRTDVRIHAAGQYFLHWPVVCRMPILIIAEAKYLPMPRQEILYFWDRILQRETGRCASLSDSVAGVYQWCLCGSPHSESVQRKRKNPLETDCAGHSDHIAVFGRLVSAEYECTGQCDDVIQLCDAGKCLPEIPRDSVCNDHVYRKYAKCDRNAL